MMKMAKEKRKVRIVNDQFGQPTWTLKLSKYIFHKIFNNEYDGINHMTGSGIASRFEFAREIYKLMGSDPNLVQPISSAEYQTKAKRPSYSLLKRDDVEGVVDNENWKYDLRSIFEMMDK
jgi:dTDP-4-dehydrorhamnose reductase